MYADGVLVALYQVLQIHTFTSVQHLFDSSGKKRDCIEKMACELHHIMASTNIDHESYLWQLEPLSVLPLMSQYSGCLTHNMLGSVL